MVSLVNTRSRHVRIGGWVKDPLQLDAPALESLGARTLPPFPVICTLDGPHGAPLQLRGVRLDRLLERAQPAFEQRTDFKRVAVVAEGADGYRALFSWMELFQTVVGDGVYIAFDSKESSTGNGISDFSLISRHDRATGPRYVRGLVAVDLIKLW